MIKLKERILELMDEYPALSSEAERKVTKEYMSILLSRLTEKNSDNTLDTDLDDTDSDTTIDTTIDTDSDTALDDTDSDNALDTDLDSALTGDNSKNGIELRHCIGHVLSVAGKTLDIEDGTSVVLTDGFDFGIDSYSVTSSSKFKSYYIRPGTIDAEMETMICKLHGGIVKLMNADRAQYEKTYNCSSDNERSKMSKPEGQLPSLTKPVIKNYIAGRSAMQKDRMDAMITTLVYLNPSSTRDEVFAKYFFCMNKPGVIKLALTDEAYNMRHDREAFETLIKYAETMAQYNHDKEERKKRAEAKAKKKSLQLAMAVA